MDESMVFHQINKGGILLLKRHHMIYVILYGPLQIFKPKKISIRIYFTIWRNAKKNLNNLFIINRKRFIMELSHINYPYVIYI